MALKALTIDEAEDGVISIAKLPDAGATALIPAPPIHSSDDVISIFISGNEVVKEALLGEESDGFFKHKVSKADLLQQLGSGKEFTYTIWYRGGNPDYSDAVTYSIDH